VITYRAYRKATSLVTLYGHTFRVTDAFIAHLLITIGVAENVAVTTAHYVPTASGTATPMTLSELYELRLAIHNQQAGALASQVI
jgi:hypothetical protein